MIKHYTFHQCVCCEALTLTRGKGYERFDAKKSIIPLIERVYDLIHHGENKLHGEFDGNKEFKDKEYLCNEPNCQKMKILL